MKSCERSLWQRFVSLFLVMVLLSSNFGVIGNTYSDDANVDVTVTEPTTTVNTEVVEPEVNDVEVSADSGDADADLMANITALSDSDIFFNIEWEDSEFKTGTAFNLVEYDSVTNQVKLKVSYGSQQIQEGGYAAGDLIITVKGIGAVNRTSVIEATVGADKANSNVKTRDWSYTWNRATDTYTFTNNAPIEDNSVFSGYFELVWSLNSRNTIHGYTQDTVDAYLYLPDGTSIDSDVLSFSNETKCDTYAIDIDRGVLYSASGLSDDLLAKDYVFIKYTFVSHVNRQSRGVKDNSHVFRFYTDEHHIGDGGIITYASIPYSEQDGYYNITLKDNVAASQQYVVVAYPRDTYVGETIKAYVDHYGIYYDGDDAGNTESVFLADDEIEFVCPPDFGFGDSDGDFHEIKQSYYEYKAIVDRNFANSVAAKGGHISGKNMKNGSVQTFLLGFSQQMPVTDMNSYSVDLVDDFLYIAQNDGNYRQLVSGDYEFESVVITSTTAIFNENDIPITSGEYVIKVYAVQNDAVLDILPYSVRTAETMPEIDGEFVVTDVNEIVYANTIAPIRDGVGYDYNRIGQLTFGQTITRIGVVEGCGWSVVQDADGNIGYVFSDYLSVTEPTRPAELVWEGLWMDYEQTIELPEGTTAIAVRYENLREEVWYEWMSNNAWQCDQPACRVNVRFHLQEDGLDDASKANLINGQVANTMYVELYDLDGDLVGAGRTEDDYLDDAINIDLAQKDIDIYGRYLDRDAGKISFYGSEKNDYKSYTDIGTVNASGNRFVTTFTMGANFGFAEDEYPNQFSLYTILPDGLTLSGYKADEDIWDVMSLSGFNMNRTQLANACTPEIIMDYNGSGRTYIALHFDFGDVNVSQTGKIRADFDLNVNKSILKTSGKLFARSGVLIDRTIEPYVIGKVNDIGGWGDADGLWSDIDRDGNVDELLAYSYDSNSYIYADSSQFQITKYVDTSYVDDWTYLPDVPSEEYAGSYQYKISVRNGNSTSSHIQVMDILETGENAEWQGVFQSVDLSECAKLGLTGIVYYSSSSEPGELYDSEGNLNTNWSNVKPEIVKAIVVDFGDGVLAAGKELPIIINMIAPSDSSLRNKITENGSLVSLTMSDLATGNETKHDMLESNFVQVKLTPPLRSVVVTKVDEVSGEVLSGAEFGLYLIDEETGERTGDPIAMAISNAKGYAIFHDIPADVDYILHEITAPYGYETSKVGMRTVVVESEHNPYPNGVASVTYGEVKFDGAKSLDIELTYQTESTSYDWLYMYDVNGNIINNKKYGDSILRTETISVSGDYVKFVFRSDGSVNNYYGFKAVVTGESQIDNDVVVNLNGSDVRLTVQNFRKSGQIEVHKVNALDTTMPVCGATYRLVNITNFDWFDGITSTTAFENLSSEQLVAIESNIVCDVITDENGVSIFDGLGWGKYIVYECVPATGYQLNDTIYFVEINRENVSETAIINTVDVQNDVFVYLTKYVKTTTGEETEIPLSGAIFELLRKTESGDTRVGLYATDKNGSIVITDIPYGDYYFREYRAPVGYNKCENIEFGLYPVEGSAETFVSLIAYDQRKSGSIVITKDDNLGNMIPDVEFTLWSDDKTTEIRRGVTDEYGVLEFNDLEWGTYYLQETDAPRYYEINDEYVEIVIGANSLTVYSDIENQTKKGIIVLTKMDETETFVLAGAEYMLYTADGSVMGVYTTDENGQLRVEGLEWGSYYFKETKAPAGYSLSSEMVRFSVNIYNAGLEQEIVVTDPVDAKSITLSKRIKVDEINFSNGNPTFLFELSGVDVNGVNHVYHAVIVFDDVYVNMHTDADGYVTQSVTVSNIMSGNYMVVEKDAGRYYLESIADVVNGSIYGETVVFDLQNNSDASAVFVNTKYEVQDYSDGQNLMNVLKSQAKLTSISAVYDTATVEAQSELNHDLLTVTAIYDDGSVRILSEDEYVVSMNGYPAMDGSNVLRFPNKNGDYTVNVTYTDNSCGITKCNSFTVNIYGQVPVITGLTSTNGYAALGGDIRPELFYVTAKYNDGSMRFLPPNKYVVSPDIAPNYEGDIEVTISLNLDVVVNEGRPVSTTVPVTVQSVPILMNGFRSKISGVYRRIVFTDAVAPESAFVFDISKKQDGSVVGWIYNSSNNISYSTLYISSQKRGIPVAADLGLSFIDGNVTYIDASMLDVSHMTNMSLMFRDCRSLTTLNLSGWDTSSVTTMGSMFFGCSSLTTLNLSGWDTSSVTTMGSMFEGCSSLTTLNLSGWDTSSVTNMSYMFSGCSSLTTLNLSGWDTSSVTTMGYMFYRCGGLTSLDLSDWNTSSVTNMGHMFSGCSSLTTLNLSGWGPSSVTNMGSMFSGCSSLTTLDLSDWDTSSVTNMGYMFYRCGGLTSLDLSDWNTSSVTNMGSMFYGCNSLTTLDLSSWDTSSVTDMGSMFNGCSGLTSIDLSEWDTSSVTSMYSMFSGCNSLTTLDLSDWDTSSVTNMRGMFSGCSSLTALDLSSWDTSAVTDMYYMFYNCTKLFVIFVSDLWTTNNVTSSNYMFYNCSNIIGSSGTAYNSSYINKIYARIDNGSSKPGYLWAANGMDMSYCLDTVLFTQGLSSSVTSVVFTDDVAPNDITLVDVSLLQNGNVMMWQVGSTCYVSTQIDNQKIYILNGSRLFSYKSNLVTIDMSMLDVSYVADMSSMFSGCSRLTTLNLSGWDTSSVTNMGYMFSGCSRLTTLNLSGWDTSSVTNMSNMFEGCSSLTTLNLLGLDTSSVTNMSRMFLDCSRLTTLNLSDWDTSSVTDMGWMFLNCSELVVIMVSDLWTTNNVTNSIGMFNNCHKLIGSSGTAYNSSYIDVAYAKIDNGLSNPGYLWDANGTEILYCLDTVLFTQGLSSSVTSVVFTDDVAPNDITLVDVSLLQNGNVMMWQVGSTCYVSTQIDNQKIYILNGSRLFSYKSNLVTIDISMLDVSYVTNMSYMFEGCRSLTTLDLSSWDTSSVTNMSYMFCYCDNLAMVVVSDLWITNNVIRSDNMFVGCVNLVGPVDTIYSASYVDKTYARIDEGSNNPGYLWDVKHLNSLINLTIDNQCSDLVAINIPNMIVGGVTKLSLIPLVSNQVIVSFDMNGVTIQGNTFIAPPENGIVTITNVVIETIYVVNETDDFVVVESTHNPYASNVNGLCVDVQFDDAQQLRITIDTQLGDSDRVVFYNADGYEEIVCNGVTSGYSYSIYGNYAKVVLYSDSVDNDYYGFKATIEPCYEVDVAIDNQCSDLVTIDVPDVIISNFTQFGLTPIDDMHVVTSFDLNGKTVDGNLFTIPNGVDIVTITNVVVVDGLMVNETDTGLVIETQHNPYPNNASVETDIQFEGAVALNVSVEYQLGRKDMIWLLDGNGVYVAQYYGNNTEPSTELSTESIVVLGNYLNVGFLTNLSGNEYYGAKIVVTPVWPIELTVNNQCSDSVTVDVPDVIHGGHTVLSLIPIDENSAVVSFELDDVLMHGNTFIAPEDSGTVTITDVEFFTVEYPDTVTVDVPDMVEPGVTELTVGSLVDNMLVSSFSLNGNVVQGNTFVVPIDTNVVSIGDIGFMECAVVESAHNPYPNNVDYVTYGEVTYDGAVSLNVELTYQTEATTWDWIYLYDANGNIINNKKYGDSILQTETVTIAGNYVRFVFRTDGSGNDYYGFKAVVTPNYS